MELDSPSLPMDWSEMSVPESMKKTKDDEHFLILEENLLGQMEVVWGFASALGIEIMKKAKDLFCDGTFCRSY